MISIKPDRKKRLPLAAILAVGAGIITLLPFPGATESCILGYKSVCPFSPISTTLLFCAGSMIYGHTRWPG